MEQLLWGAFVGAFFACLIAFLVGISPGETASEEDKIRAHLSAEWLIIILFLIMAFSLSVYEGNGKVEYVAPTLTPRIGGR